MTFLILDLRTQPTVNTRLWNTNYLVSSKSIPKSKFLLYNNCTNYRYAFFIGYETEIVKLKFSNFMSIQLNGKFIVNEVIAMKSIFRVVIYLLNRHLIQHLIMQSLQLYVFPILKQGQQKSLYQLNIPHYQAEKLYQVAISIKMLVLYTPLKLI